MTDAHDDDALIARVRSRVGDAIEHKLPALHCTVRAASGDWKQAAPGVECKVLWERGDAVSCMVKLAPGASFPSHGHPIDEESVILSGSLRIGADLLLKPGDFHVGLSGVDHGAISTEEGCLCFLRTARSFFAPG
jgi:anti-sigma factor ChrR (cupin superfamily)